MTPVIKSGETIEQIKQLQDKMKKLYRSFTTFPTKSKQNHMQKIDDTLSTHWKDLHRLYPEMTSEDITDYENLQSRFMDATVGAKVRKSDGSFLDIPDKSLIQDDLDKLRHFNDSATQKEISKNKILNYLNQFKSGKLAIRVNSSIAYNVLTEILDKYDISLIADSEFPDHLYEHPYVVIDDDAYAYSYENMDNVSRLTNAYDSVELSELERLDKADMLQDFKDGKLMVHVSNDTQYEKLINYLSLRDNRINYNTLSAIGFDSSNQYYRMVGSRFVAYGDYDRDNTVSFFDFVPSIFQMEATKPISRLQDYLNRFKDGKLAIQVKGYVDHENLMKILSKYNVPVTYQTEVEASFYISHPYLWVDNGLICGNKDMSYCTHDSGITECIDADKLNYLDMLQDFKDSKLVVQIDNSFQSEKLINYLRKNDVAIQSATDYTSNPSRFPYFYMLRPTELTAGESFKAIEDYVHIHKVVSFDAFVSEVLSNFNLKDFTSGQAIVRVKDKNEYEQFIRYLQKHGIKDESFPAKASSYDERFSYFYMYDNENGSPELNAGASAALIIGLHGSKCILNYSDFDFVEELQETIKETDRSDLAAFKAGKLAIHTSNSMEHRLFLEYLSNNGLSDKLYPEIKEYKEPSYFYMFKGKKSHEMMLSTVHDFNSYFQGHHKGMTFKEFYAMDIAHTIPSQVPEKTIPLSVYEQVKAERDIAFGQLEALGTSFGEKPESALNRIENDAIDCIFAAIKEKSDTLCDMVRNHYGTPRDIVQEFMENISSIIDSARNDLNSKKNDRTADAEHEEENDYER